MLSRRWFACLCLLLEVGWFVLISATFAIEPPALKQPQGVLDYLAAMNQSVRPVEETIAAAISRGDLEQAEKLCRQLIADVPFAPSGYYNLACVEALRNKRTEALEHLSDAVERGFGRVELMQQDPDLATLRDDLQFEELLTRARKAPSPFKVREPEPFIVQDQTAFVQNENTAFTGERLLRTAFRFDVPQAANLPVTTLDNKAGKLLKEWQATGAIAGNVGDLYDNRDGDHSDLNRKLFPQLTWIEYSTAAKTAQLHWGLQDRLHHDGVVIGNASVARTQGPFWRSMPRLAYENQPSADVLYKQYREQKLYFYPGHLDHSPGHNGTLGDKAGGHGDVFPANTPYLIASQGSSGSDQVFLQAFAATLAAFPPDTKAALVKAGLLMPALQMIFRRANKSVESDDDYLTGKAHPTVFSGQNLRPETMVQMAHEMPSTKMPPLALIKVMLEDEPQPNRDFFDLHTTERLFDTPCAIARVFRGTAHSRRIMLDAAESFDAQKLPLTFHWKVLRGNADQIRIVPLNGDGSKVEIVIPYHPRLPIAPGHELASNRVDIALFVHNGSYYSPPAMLTFYSLDHEQRTYDQAHRIQSVVYSGAEEAGNYTDPIVSLPKSWRDDYHYNGTGHLTGWTRTFPHESKTVKAIEFTPEGKLILETDAEGKPSRTASVRYVARPRQPHQSPILIQTTDMKTP